MAEVCLSGEGVSSDWTGEENIAPIRFRRDMDKHFRGTITKSTCWEELGRRLECLGFKRNGMECADRFNYLLKCCKWTGGVDATDDRLFAALESLYAAPSLSPQFQPKKLPVPVPAMPLPQWEVDHVSSSRWSRTETHALIQLRVEYKEKRELGTKDGLWEDLSQNMEKLGFKRSSKECKKRWTRLNKRYQKKKRADRETKWRYFHVLQAIELIVNSTASSRSVNASSQCPTPPSLDINEKRAPFDLNMEGTETLI